MEYLHLVLQPQAVPADNSTLSTTSENATTQTAPAPAAAPATASYFHALQDVSVAQARHYCLQQEWCVSFGFQSHTTQFPAAVLSDAYFYPFADWHVLLGHQVEPAFVEDPYWHLYVNTTREAAAIPAELQRIVATLDQLFIAPAEKNAGQQESPCVQYAINVDDQDENDDIKTEAEAETASSKKRSSLRRGSSSDNAMETTISSEAEELRNRHLMYHHFCLQPQQILLESIFHLVFPHELKDIATTPPLIVKLLQVAQDTSLQKETRMIAVNDIMVMADCHDTALRLVQAGVYEVMTTIIQQELSPPPSAQQQQQQTDNLTITNGNWDGLPILALDVISNICMYRHEHANQLLRQKGATQFLLEIIRKETNTAEITTNTNAGAGFPALQSFLALLHLTTTIPTTTTASTTIPTASTGLLLHDMNILSKSTLFELVQLLQNSIDGDVMYGILWDLLPGPLSAIQLLLIKQQQQNQHSINKNSVNNVIDTLLDAGLMEKVLRILEAPCLVASHTSAALDILQRLAHVSKRAREMILLMAAHAIQKAQARLEEYQQPAQVARELTQIVSHHDFANSGGGWMSEEL